MMDFLQFVFSLPADLILGGVLFAVIAAAVLVLLVPDLMRMLIFPAFLVIAFMAYKIAGPGAAVVAIIIGLLVVLANPKPPGGYIGQQ